jgi:hypothetical protein
MHPSERLKTLCGSRLGHCTAGNTSTANNLSAIPAINIKLKSMMDMPKRPGKELITGYHCSCGRMGLHNTRLVHSPDVFRSTTLLTPSRLREMVAVERIEKCARNYILHKAFQIYEVDGGKHNM